MRALAVIAVIVLLLSIVGWLKFSSPDGNPTIRVDRNKIEHDTAVMVDESKEALDQAAQKVDASIDR